MKIVKVCYTNRNNLGDAINPYIINRLLDGKCAHKRALAPTCDMTGIGSGLRRFFVGTNDKKNSLLLPIGKLNRKPLYIWSAGFLRTPSGDERVLRQDTRVASVRGELSRTHIEQILNRKVDCLLGDGGLLVSDLMKPTSVKRYTIGIIPHDRERDEKKYMDIQRNTPGSVMIDVRADVLDSLQTISQCEAIISSSLHGLILADSFHVPNMHVVLTNKLSGDGFKFKDYYSCYGKEDKYLDLNEDCEISVQRIKECYSLAYEEIENTKLQIKKAFFESVS